MSEPQLVSTQLAQSDCFEGQGDSLERDYYGVGSKGPGFAGVGSCSGRSLDEDKEGISVARIRLTPSFGRYVPMRRWPTILAYALYIGQEAHTP